MVAVLCVDNSVAISNLADDLLVGRYMPAARFGVAFGVPYGNVIYAHVVTGRRCLTVIGRLARLVDAGARDGAPGGAVSPFTYYWRDASIEPISVPGSGGKVPATASGKFGALLEHFKIAQPRKTS